MPAGHYTNSYIDSIYYSQRFKGRFYNFYKLKNTIALNTLWFSS